MAGEAEIKAIEAVLSGPQVDTGLFAPSFLAAVPPAQLQGVVDSLKATIGPVVAVTEQSGTRYTVETGTHRIPVEIVLDPGGKISGLLFRAVVALNASLDELLAELGAIAPDSAFIVVTDGERVAGKDDNKPLAVGSAFKLGILKALENEVATGRLRWDDVHTLRAADISLPSGMLQGWPIGAPLTLHTLAALMISISDNTATDALLHLLGRDKVEAVLRIAPVMSTRELFTLKADPALRARYLAADEEARRSVLDEIRSMPLPDVGRVNTPHEQGLEWYLSAAALCALIGDVAQLDVTRINPGVADSADWATVAFKGGSEIGVLSLVTQVQAKSGKTHCVVAVWNAPAAIDEGRATAAYAGVLARLARE